MKHHFADQLLAVVLLCFLPAVSRAANLARNPGFEEGFANWTGPGWNITDVSHSGMAAAELNGFDTGGGLFQDIPTTPGREYLITFYIAGTRPDGADPLSFRLGIWFGDRAADDVFEFSIAPVYRRWYTFPTIADTTLTRLTFRQSPSVNSGTLRIDDVCVDVNGGVCGFTTDIPEPGNCWLLATGIVAGYLGVKRRRRP